MIHKEFNNKWKNYLVYGSYGCRLQNKEALDFLNKEFSRETLTNMNFQYYLIEIIDGKVVCHTTSDKNRFWENSLNQIYSQSI